MLSIYCGNMVRSISLKAYVLNKVWRDGETESVCVCVLDCLVSFTYFYYIFFLKTFASSCLFCPLLLLFGFGRYCLSYIPFARDIVKRCCRRIVSGGNGNGSGGGGIGGLGIIGGDDGEGLIG